MREIYFFIEQFPSCCKVDVLHYFNTCEVGKAITDEEWFGRLQVESLTCSLVTFAHSSKMNTGKITPKSFAHWLRRRGETVTQVKDRHVTLYTCRLSKKFWKDFDNYKKNKKKTLNAEYERSCRAA